MKNLEKIYDLLKQLLQLRFTNVKELVDSKITEYSLKSEMYHLRTEMMKGKTKTDFFNETPISLQAYKELFNNMSEQQADYHKQITNLNQLKQQYKLVACREYNEILKSYLQYKDAVEKKMALYKQLKEK